MRRSRSPYPVIPVIFVFATDSRTGKRGACCTESHKTHFATLAKRQAPLRCELILIIDSESERASPMSRRQMCRSARGEEFIRLTNVCSNSAKFRGLVRTAHREDGE
jgi:hypothetical protein